jgi:hypothetical protein
MLKMELNLITNQDQVVLIATIDSNVKITTGGGDDFIDAYANGAGSHISGSAKINCGGGTDTVNLGGNTATVSKNCENVIP